MMQPLRQLIHHAFAIPRRPHESDRDGLLVQWSQWRSAEERRREAKMQQQSLVTIRCASCRRMMRAVPRYGRCPTCGLSVRRTMQVAGRVPGLFAISILGMGGLGALAILGLLTLEMIAVPAASIDAGDVLFAVLVLVPVCFMIGGFVGIFSAPIVILALRRIELRFALPLVYGGSAIVTLGYLLVPMAHSGWFPLDSAVPAFVSVCVLSGVAAAVCPKIDVRPPGVCSEYGYNLRGNTSGVCPECGAGVRQEVNSRGVAEVAEEMPS